MPGPFNSNNSPQILLYLPRNNRQTQYNNYMIYIYVYIYTYICISTEHFYFDILMLTLKLTDTFSWLLEKAHFLYMYIVFQMIRIKFYVQSERLCNYILHLQPLDVCHLRHGFNPWSRKIPHAMEQLAQCTTTIEPVSQSPRSTREATTMRSLGTTTIEKPHLTTTREKPM